MRSGSVIAVDSVISTVTRVGSIPATTMGDTILSTRSGCHSWRGDRLKPISRSSPSARHCASWRQISSTTQSPIASIRPISSASGMNSPGGTRPAVGLGPADQGFHTEHPAGRQLDQRLVVQHPLPLLDGLAQPRGQGEARQRRCVLAGVHHVSAGPRLLAAVHRSVRVLHQRAMASAASSGKTLMPRLAAAYSSVPSTMKRALSACWMRVATPSAEMVGAVLTARQRRRAIEVAQQHEELVAARARHEVGVARGVVEPLGELAR